MFGGEAAAILLLLILVVFVEFVLHVGNCFGVQLSLNTRSLFDDVKVFEEVIEAKHALFQILNTDFAIIVEIKAHPVVFYCDLDFRVSTVNIFSDLRMFGGNHLDVADNLVSRIIIQKEYILNNWPQFLV